MILFQILFLSYTDFIQISRLIPKIVGPSPNVAVGQDLVSSPDLVLQGPFCVQLKPFTFRQTSAVRVCSSNVVLFPQFAKH